MEPDSTPAAALPDLTGRVAIVTGGGRGIGRATALDLAAAGAAVAVVARTAAEVELTAATIIGERGGRALAVTADLADRDTLARLDELVARVGTELGPIGILINNAATVNPLGRTADLDAESVDAALRLNVTALIALTGAALPGLVAAGWGRIVNVSSGVAANPDAMIGGGTYAATKAAVEAHTINLATELAGTGVTANAYRPGGVDTAMQESIRGQDPRRVGELVTRFRDTHAAGRLLTPEASARRLVTRLASMDSGQIWDVSDPAPPDAP
ncbi:MAG TPA: SDR family oxidoreductase [Mycobacteriales bacterium]|nr:SDR family oxidoreductase [Mycobacteriales bacterium]